MSSHSDCSPSSLERRDGCSASCFEESKLVSKDDEAAKRGTRLHKLMEWHLKRRVNLDNLNEDERTNISKAFEMAEMALGDEILPDGTTANGGVWHAEVKLLSKSTAAAGHNDWGTCDLLVVYRCEKRAVVLDWKFGGGLIHHPKWNLQLQCYIADAWDWLAEKFGPEAYEFVMETTYIQPAAAEKYEWNPWVFEPDERHRIVAKIRAVRERAYSGVREYVVGPACDMCEAKKQGTCWARQQMLKELLPLAGIQSTEALDPVALGRAIDAAEVVRQEADRIWDLLKASVSMGQNVDGWLFSEKGNRLYRKVTDRTRISEPFHLRMNNH